MGPFKDIGVEKSGLVATIEIRRPPNNFFDVALINQIADALEEFDRDIEEVQRRPPDFDGADVADFVDADVCKFAHGLSSIEMS